MTIKARLTLAVVALLVVLTAVLGVITIRSTRSSMVEQIDERLVAIASDRRRAFAAGRHGRRGRAERYRDIAEFLYSSEGRLLDARPAGFSDDPESGPDLPRSRARRSTRSSTTGSSRSPPPTARLDYRVLVFAVRDGNIQVVAQTLSDVDEAVTLA